MAKCTPDPDFILRDVSMSSVTFITLIPAAGMSSCLVCGTDKGQVIAWKMQTRRVGHSVMAHPGIAVLWLKAWGASKVLSYGRDGYFRLWTISEDGFKKEEEMSVPCVGFCCPTEVVLPEDGHLLALPGEKTSSVDIISFSRKKTFFHVLEDSKGNKGMVMVLKMVNLECGIVAIMAGYENGNLLLWDVDSKKVIHTLPAHREPILAMDYHAGVNRGVSGSVDDQISVWTLSNAGNMEIFKRVAITNPGVNCIRIRDDGRLFASGGWDSLVRLYSCKKVTLLVVLSCHTDSIQSVHFTEDNTLFVGSKDGVISAWSIYAS